MKITELLGTDKKLMSFEVFPPKTSDKFDTVQTAANAIAALGPSFMSVTYGAGGGTSKYTFDIARKLLPMCVDIRRSGTAAWDMCCVAMGVCNLYFELRIQIWDYAAAALIAEEAGCTVTDLVGDPLTYTGPSAVLCRARGVADIPECFR